MQRYLLAGVTVLLIGASWCWSGNGVEVFGQRPAPTAQAGGELITHTVVVNDKIQLLTVIDPRARAVAVYQIDTASGAIALRSARNMVWDLQLTEFNSANPLPREIRTLLEQK